MVAERLTFLEKNHLLSEDFVGVSESTVERTVLRREVEKVKNIDEKVIELVLKSENVKVNPTAGFLVEVFLSGSDGKLERLFEKDLTDLYGNVLEDGFSNYLIVDIDSKK